MLFMEVVKKTKTPIIITKRGVPIAQLNPIEENWDATNEQ